MPLAWGLDSSLEMGQSQRYAMVQKWNMEPQETGSNSFEVPMLDFKPTIDSTRHPHACHMDANVFTSQIFMNYIPLYHHPATKRLQVLIEGCHQHLVLLHPPAILIWRRPLLLGVAVGASTEGVAQAGGTWVWGITRGHWEPREKCGFGQQAKAVLPTEVIDFMQEK